MLPPCLEYLYESAGSRIQTPLPNTKFRTRMSGSGGTNQTDGINLGGVRSRMGGKDAADGSGMSSFIRRTQGVRGLSPGADIYQRTSTSQSATGPKGNAPSQMHGANSNDPSVRSTRGTRFRAPGVRSNGQRRWGNNVVNRTVASLSHKTPNFVKNLIRPISHVISRLGNI